MNQKWEVRQTESNIIHVIPIDDIEEHEDWIGWLDGYPSHGCNCLPKIELSEKGAWIFIHNSYDGREGIEWATEILKTK